MSYCGLYPVFIRSTYLRFLEATFSVRERDICMFAGKSLDLPMHAIG